MPRILPLADDRVPPAAQADWVALRRHWGRLPNFVRTVAHSPAALQGWRQLAEALRAGATLAAAQRETVALATAAVNGCAYCRAAHRAGAVRAGLDAAAIEAAEAGALDAVARLARRIAESRGHVGDDELDAARAAGLGEGQLIEIAAQVALNTLTNLVNNLAATEVDLG